MIGVEEDPSDASIACRQVGPIKVLDELEEGEEVFKQRTSLIFKSMQVVRFFDQKRKVFVYLVYSDRVIEGSPKNSISAVPAMAWAGEAPVLPPSRRVRRALRRCAGRPPTSLRPIAPASVVPASAIER